MGLVPEIDRYTAEGHKYRLSISLGAATDEKRRQLVPVAARNRRMKWYGLRPATAASRSTERSPSICPCTSSPRAWL